MNYSNNPVVSITIMSLIIIGGLGFTVWEDIARAINKRNKEVLTYLLSKIDNLYLSYKLSSPFSSFYKSSLINDLNLEIIKPDEDTLNKLKEVVYENTCD